MSHGRRLILAVALASIACVTPALAGFRTGAASPPAGFHEFCKRFPAECRSSSGPTQAALTEALLSSLKRVNTAVNREIREVSDNKQYGVEDYWTLPTSGAGDCEDFALLKRQRLVALGVPSSVLLVTVVRDRRGEGHAVLTVVTDKGNYVLDNKTNTIKPWSQTGYKFYSMQSSASPKVWVAVGGSSPVARTATPKSALQQTSLYQWKHGRRGIR